MHPNPPRLLAQLIEFGHATDVPGPRDLPLEWRLAYDAVRKFHNGSRDQRVEAFWEGTKDNPLSMKMWFEMQTVAYHPPDRDKPVRIIHSAGKTLDPQQPMDWCVDGLFTRPSLNLLVGDPGSKKTFLALDLAACVALGKPWLDRQISVSPVLIIDEETGFPRLSARLHGVLHAHKAPPDVPLHFISLAGFDLRKDEEAEELTEHAQSVSAGLIIIDALADVMRGGDENSVLSVAPVFFHLRRLTEACNAAVIVLHHTNKHGLFRGSTSISAAVDLMLSVESEANDSLIHLRTVKARDVFPDSFSARAHFEENRFWLTSTEDQPSKLNPTAVAILDYLSENSYASTAQLMSRIQARTPDRVRKVTYQLMASGLIDRANGGSQGKTAIFKLSQKGRSLLNLD